jgi:hypothetical protein
MIFGNWLWALRRPPTEEQFPPRLRTLAHTVGEADKPFLPSGVAPMMISRHCAVA